jgi:hypothetical protein
MSDGALFFAERVTVLQSWQSASWRNSSFSAGYDAERSDVALNGVNVSGALGAALPILLVSAIILLALRGAVR